MTGLFTLLKIHSYACSKVVLSPSVLFCLFNAFSQNLKWFWLQVASSSPPSLAFLLQFQNT